MLSLTRYNKYYISNNSSGFAEVHPPKQKAEFMHLKGIVFRVTKSVLNDSDFVVTGVMNLEYLVEYHQARILP